MEPEFKIVSKGYDPKSVDIYIDSMREEFDQLTRDNAALKLKVNELESNSPQREDIYQALLSAQNAGKQIEAEAREKAESILSAASAEAQTLINEAQASVTRAFEDTRSKTGEIIAAAQARADKIVARANERALLSKETQNNIKKELTELYDALASLMKGGGADA